MFYYSDDDSLHHPLVIPRNVVSNTHVELPHPSPFHVAYRIHRVHRVPAKGLGSKDKGKFVSLERIL